MGCKHDLRVEKLQNWKIGTKYVILSIRSSGKLVLLYIFAKKKEKKNLTHQVF